MAEPTHTPVIIRTVDELRIERRRRQRSFYAPLADVTYFDEWENSIAQTPIPESLDRVAAEGLVRDQIDHLVENEPALQPLLEHQRTHQVKELIKYSVSVSNSSGDYLLQQAMKAAGESMHSTLSDSDLDSNDPSVRPHFTKLIGLLTLADLLAEDVDEPRPWVRK